MLTSLPNLLTLSRIAAIPGLVALLFFDAPLYRWLACGLFAVAALTDYFDGYLARYMGQISAFGRFIDPIADKLFVAATLLMLVHAERVSEISVIAVLIILCREILVSGLREFLAGTAASLPVTKLAKWKTGLQMASIGVLIMGDVGNMLINPILGIDLPLQLIGEILLWGAAVLTLITGYDYLRAGLRHMKATAPAPTPAPKPEDISLKRAEPARPAG
ncbi:MAG: CDP-diacylglycerol--glycerol-3-phosphate 3-phosphatidyltransferase [Alphaproteobacteria bacterium]|nr:CDP-diacylglycerol--glycerol-3-phosphate 3-phosphatidyltransferase [Alphaproteobacteria bacterium]MBU0795841.1 CDP-diacylglycerol--glycerol-3-phosphate 3-phosphatidyltransferase [Alphaproteobacteria bacterium]MBU0885751.1 CDP-diacylglycerol--glycerol-3-phosphate 3-phosphatidyltransferase [Alphaproteobacteria bacterium]MBU1814454.1 CDP-diacylglycerol--glycerol-3-phosphate 3-phosphatidyltransferase [Alphaproteobacteria bacterium]MBU2090844.1 CDP-diacylglycerol--glycerol-3-phosphate 3-phosphati